ncbi:MAG: DUF2829 domain-containing protein [Neptuniibacter sp.]
MSLHIGTKLINAVPMTRLEYTEFRGWTLPVDENPNDAGYLVEYLDGGTANTKEYSGYVSWSPKDVFDKAYNHVTSMTFGDALVFLKAGGKVARKGWNGKDMFLYHVKANSYPVSGNPGSAVEGMFENDMVPYGAYIAMKTAQDNVVPWLASQTDMLADDWVLIK